MRGTNALPPAARGLVPRRPFARTPGGAHQVPRGLNDNTSDVAAGMVTHCWCNEASPRLDAMKPHTRDNDATKAYG